MVDKKSDQAYRNIREAAEILELRTHVLRFWETKFEKLQPMTRGGGRRYYSPEDIELLETIKELVHNRGMTIRAAAEFVDKYGANAVYVAPARKAANDQTVTKSESEASPASHLHRSQIDSLDAKLAKIEAHVLSQIATLDRMIEKFETSYA